MSQRFISVERRDRLLLITINRPELRNALHYPAHCQLQAAFDDFAADPGLGVAIITGAGTQAFCAGHDLKHPIEPGSPVVPSCGFAGLVGRFDLDKPVIAAVNGAAYGGGFETALACDLIIAADNASFALPEVKVGLAALAGGLHRLPRAVGLHRAMAMILTGRKITAAEAQSMGLVQDLVAGADLLATAQEWAAAILACDPLAVRASKQAVMRGLDGTVAQAMAEQGGYPAMSELMQRVMQRYR